MSDLSSSRPGSPMPPPPMSGGKPPGPRPPTASSVDGSGRAGTRPPSARPASPANPPGLPPSTPPGVPPSSSITPRVGTPVAPPSMPPSRPTSPPPQALPSMAPGNLSRPTSPPPRTEGTALPSQSPPASRPNSPPPRTPSAAPPSKAPPPRRPDSAATGEASIAGAKPPGVRPPSAAPPGSRPPTAPPATPPAAPGELAGPRVPSRPPSAAPVNIEATKPPGLPPSRAATPSSDAARPPTAPPSRPPSAPPADASVISGSGSETRPSSPPPSRPASAVGMKPSTPPPVSSVTGIASKSASPAASRPPTAAPSRATTPGPTPVSVPVTSTETSIPVSSLNPTPKPSRPPTPLNNTESSTAPLETSPTGVDILEKEEEKKSAESVPEATVATPAKEEESADPTASPKVTSPAPSSDKKLSWKERMSSFNMGNSKESPSAKSPGASSTPAVDGASPEPKKWGFLSRNVKEINKGSSSPTLGGASSPGATSSAAGDAPAAVPKWKQALMSKQTAATTGSAASGSSSPSASSAGQANSSPFGATLRKSSNASTASNVSAATNASNSVLPSWMQKKKEKDEKKAAEAAIAEKAIVEAEAKPVDLVVDGLDLSASPITSPVREKEKEKEEEKKEEEKKEPVVTVNSAQNELESNKQTSDLTSAVQNITISTGTPASTPTPSQLVQTFGTTSSDPLIRSAIFGVAAASTVERSPQEETSAESTLLLSSFLTVQPPATLRSAFSFSEGSNAGAAASTNARNTQNMLPSSTRSLLGDPSAASTSNTALDELLMHSHPSVSMFASIPLSAPSLSSSNNNSNGSDNYKSIAAPVTSPLVQSELTRQSGLLATVAAVSLQSLRESSPEARLAALESARARHREAEAKAKRLQQRLAELPVAVHTLEKDMVRSLGLERARALSGRIHDFSGKMRGVQSRLALVSLASRDVAPIVDISRPLFDSLNATLARPSSPGAGQSPSSKKGALFVSFANALMGEEEPKQEIVPFAPSSPLGPQLYVHTLQTHAVPLQSDLRLVRSQLEVAVTEESKMNIETALNSDVIAMCVDKARRLAVAADAELAVFNSLSVQKLLEAFYEPQPSSSFHSANPNSLVITGLPPNSSVSTGQGNAKSMVELMMLSILRSYEQNEAAIAARTTTQALEWKLLMSFLKKRKALEQKKISLKRDELHQLQLQRQQLESEFSAMQGSVVEFATQEGDHIRQLESEVATLEAENSANSAAQGALVARARELCAAEARQLGERLLAEHRAETEASIRALRESANLRFQNIIDEQSVIVRKEFGEIMAVVEGRCLENEERAAKLREQLAIVHLKIDAARRQNQHILAAAHGSSSAATRARRAQSPSKASSAANAAKNTAEGSLSANQELLKVLTRVTPETQVLVMKLGGGDPRRALEVMKQAVRQAFAKRVFHLQQLQVSYGVASPTQGSGVRSSLQNEIERVNAEKLAFLREAVGAAPYSEVLASLLRSKLKEARSRFSANNALVEARDMSMRGVERDVGLIFSDLISSPVSVERLQAKFSAPAQDPVSLSSTLGTMIDNPHSTRLSPRREDLQSALNASSSALNSVSAPRDSFGKSFPSTLSTIKSSLGDKNLQTQPTQSEHPSYLNNSIFNSKLDTEDGKEEPLLHFQSSLKPLPSQSTAAASTSSNTLLKQFADNYLQESLAVQRSVGQTQSSSSTGHSVVPTNSQNGVQLLSSLLNGPTFLPPPPPPKTQPNSNANVTKQLRSAFAQQLLADAAQPAAPSFPSKNDFLNSLNGIRN